VSLDTRGRAAGVAMRDSVDAVLVPNPAVVVGRRVRQRRSRASVIALVVLLFVGVVALSLLRRDDGGVTVATSDRGAARVDDRYVPATTTARGTTRMPLTLPDGRRFTVNYAQGLRLAKLGFRSTVAATLLLGDDERNVQTRTLSVLHTTAAERYPGLAPTATYPDAVGRPVPYYVDPAAPDRGGLAVQIGSWLVIVPDLDDPANHPDDHLTPNQLAVWAQDVGGWIDDRGFLILSSTGRALTLDQSAKGAFVLGPTSKHSGSVSVGERWLCAGPGTDSTTPRRFPATPSGAAKGAAWCDRATGLHVTVVGPQRFVDRAIDSLRIAPFSAAKRATRVLLSTRTVAAGGSIPAKVIVVNNTGRTLAYDGCGGLFQLALTKPGHLPALGWFGCSTRITIPEGETSFPASALAAPFSCPSNAPCALEPGRYDAVVAQRTSDFPTPPPIPVHVVAATG
jgi:hypothetical protein